MLRLVGLVASTVCAAAAMYSSRVYHRDDYAWSFLGAAFVLALLWQNRLVLGEPVVPARVTAPGWRRAILGGVLTSGGAALWVWAPYAMFQDWNANFDGAWLAWLAGTVVLSVGLELLWGRREQAAKASRSRRLWPFLLVVGLLGVSAVYRLENLASFPGEGYVTQVEELQNGMFGQGYLDGGRWRWEYLGETWVAALGISLGGPTLLAVRTVLGVVSTLKTIPVFLWLTCTVGSLGAAVGTALLTCASWDVIFSRIGQPNQIVPAITFALLAGPVRRGRPAAYVWLGFIGGYLLYQYIAFRPLILLMPAAATVFSLRDTAIRWRLRLLRPLITLTLIVSMGLPLFLNRLHDIVQVTYFDGFYRARTYGEYYSPNDSWQETAHKRVARAFAAAGLFFFHGDPNPVHNIGTRPVVDPVTATLMLFGVASCLTQLGRGIFGLTLFMFLLGLAGTLVVTGNWDVGRAANTMVYPYVLAGFGAAAVAAVLAAAWRRGGRLIAVALMTAAVPIAAYLNTSFLLDFWSVPLVRVAMHNNLAFISSWLRQNVRSGERVVMIAPGYTYVLNPNDAMWMRGPIQGIAVPDIESALRELATNPGQTLLVLFSGSSVSSVQNYLEWLIPGLRMQFEFDPDRRGGELAYAHLSDRLPCLVARIEAARCLGVQGEYEILGSAGETLAHVTGSAPFIDYTSWSAEMGRLFEKFGPNVTGISMRLQAAIMIDAPGKYVFAQEGDAVWMEMLIDGNEYVRGAPVDLDAGPHRLEILCKFRGSESAQIRLLWKGPGTQDQLEVMPLYRLAEVGEACADGQHQERGVSRRRAWCPDRPLESEASDCQDIALESPDLQDGE
ncbi:MAG: hypothetical protein ACHQ9S_18600 [Candidatus Binatia bacterium]